MKWLPKEAAVGGIFALGTAFFVLCRPPPPSWQFCAAAVLFGIVCFLNCALITSWERNACDQIDPHSFLNAFPSLATHGRQPMCWIAAGIAGTAGLAAHAEIFLPLTLAALSLGALDRWQRHLSPDALRTLADIVLLTPWITYGAVAVRSCFR